MKETLALPEPAGLGDVEIDSYNLLDYLSISDNTLFRGRVTFANSLDLEMVEPFLRELHTTEQLGYVHPQETRERFASFDLQSIKHPGIREIERQRRESWQAFVDKQEPEERFRSIYRHSDDGIIYVTPPVHQAYASGIVDTLDLYAAGHDPLFEVHTHPINALFSAADYQRMIMSLSGTGQFRIARGAIVLCPDIQIMALVTPETIHLNPEQLGKFMDRYDINKSEEGLKIGEITEGLVKIADLPFTRRMKMLVETQKRILGEEEYFMRGLYAEAEFKAAIDKAVDSHSRNLAAFDENYSKNHDNEIDALLLERRKLYYLVEWQIAREVRPKLYFATDFRHFKEFTA